VTNRATRLCNTQCTLIIVVINQSAASQHRVNASRAKTEKKSKYISRGLKYRWRAYRPVRMGHSGRTVYNEFSQHNVADRGVIQTLWEELAGEVAHRDQLITCLLK